MVRYDNEASQLSLMQYLYPVNKQRNKVIRKLIDRFWQCFITVTVNQCCVSASALFKVNMFQSYSNFHRKTIPEQVDAIRPMHVIFACHAILRRTPLCLWEKIDESFFCSRSAQGYSVLSVTLTLMTSASKVNMTLIVCTSSKWGQHQITGHLCNNVFGLTLFNRNVLSGLKVSAQNRVLPCFDVLDIAECLSIVCVWVRLCDRDVHFVLLLVHLSAEIHQVRVANIKCLLRLGWVVVEMIAYASHLLARCNTSLCHWCHE